MDNRKYRTCVRVVITRGDKVLLGDKYMKGKFVGHEFPGGGVEDGDSLETTVVKECLEEVGIKVGDIKALGVTLQYDVEYSKPERAKLYRGGNDHFFVCRYLSKNEKVLGADNDELPHQWVTIKEAICLINESDKPPNEYNKTRIKVLKIVADMFDLKTESVDIPLIFKW
jgi:8-oxo-dGTP pyrophosphatase MutT (NUDIX family)